MPYEIMICIVLTIAGGMLGFIIGFFLLELFNYQNKQADRENKESKYPRN